MDEAYAAMGSVTGSMYTEANGHSLLQGAQNACGMDSSRSLNDVMTELTGGQVIAAPSDDATDERDGSSGSAGANEVSEACGFGGNEPYYTVEILTNFPDVWKNDAPLPNVSGQPVCHQLAPDTAQVHRYWVYFEDEQAGEAPALAWDAALTTAGYAKSCAAAYNIVNARADARMGNCGYVASSGLSATIEYKPDFGWTLMFFPVN